MAYPQKGMGIGGMDIAHRTIYVVLRQIVLMKVNVLKNVAKHMTVVLRNMDVMFLRGWEISQEQLVRARLAIALSLVQFQTLYKSQVVLLLVMTQYLRRFGSDCYT